MDKSDKKVRKIFPIFAGICVLLLPLVVWSAFSFQPETEEALIDQDPSPGFDYNSHTVFENYDQLSKAYLEGASPARTLAEYYSRRQYLGSPPYIPHKIEDEQGDALTCLTCHAKGGWTEEFKRHTPLTPHPQQTECRQCHVPMPDGDLFVENLWVSIPPPKLGRSYLPGGPPPIPHALQMRENCIACHVGPGAVEGLRVNHASRGNCRQCHVPDAFDGLFERTSDY